MHSLKTIWMKMRKEFMENFEPIPPEISTDYILQKASAWYYVTYADPKPVHLSFPWIMSQQLQEIKRRKLTKTGSPRNAISMNSFKSHLQKQLEYCIADEQVKPLPKNLEPLCVNAAKSNVPPIENLKLFLRVMIHWGYHHEIISKNANDLNNDKQFTMKIFAILCLNMTKNFPRNMSLIDMILRFFTCSINARFQIPAKGKNQDPSKLKKVKFVGHKAMYTYHHLGMTGNMAPLGICVSHDSLDIEEQEMDPICLSTELVRKFKDSNFLELKNHLKKVSGVINISVRSQGRSKCLLSAVGIPSALKSVRDALVKSQDMLLQLGEN